MTLGDLFYLGDIRSIVFECQQPQPAAEEKSTTPPRVLDAFSLLMSGQKVPMKKKAEWYLFFFFFVYGVYIRRHSVCPSVRIFSEHFFFYSNHVSDL